MERIYEQGDVLGSAFSMVLCVVVQIEGRKEGREGTDEGTTVRSTREAVRDITSRVWAPRVDSAVDWGVE